MEVCSLGAKFAHLCRNGIREDYFENKAHMLNENKRKQTHTHTQTPTNIKQKKTHTHTHTQQTCVGSHFPSSDLNDFLSTYIFGGPTWWMVSPDTFYPKLRERERERDDILSLPSF